MSSDVCFTAVASCGRPDEIFVGSAHNSHGSLSVWNEATAAQKLLNPTSPVPFTLQTVTSLQTQRAFNPRARAPRRSLCRKDPITQLRDITGRCTVQILKHQHLILYIHLVETVFMCFYTALLYGEWNSEDRHLFYTRASLWRMGPAKIKYK